MLTQMAWAEGAALSQTIYTCTYLHDYVVQGIEPLPHWSHQALYACVLATVKTCALQWRELMRNQVMEVRTCVYYLPRARTFAVIRVELPCLTASRQLS